MEALRLDSSRTKYAVCRCALTLVILCAATQIDAQTWNGGGANNLWSTGANWTGGIAPVNNGTAALAFAGSTRLTPDMDANWNILSLAFNSAAGAFTLGSTGAFTLTIQGGGITNNSASTETINNAITLGAAQTWSATSGALSFGGNIANGGFLLTISGGLNTTASGVISGAGGLTKSGAGTLTLSGTNTYSGGTTFNAGTVSISSDANLGASSGSLTFNGGTLAAATNVVGTRAIIMTGAGVFSESFGNTLEESGAVSGNGNLTVTGNGTLILSGSGSNGTGTTTVSGAVLSLRGTVSLGSGNLALSGGLLELGSGNFTRALGVAAGQVNMSSASGGAGFAAYGADRTVNLGGSGATVTWGAGNFVASGQTLYLGTPTADHMVDFQNPIDLNGASRTITVTKGTGTGVDAKISGVISGTGASGLVISTVGFAPWNPGTIVLSGINTYAGGTTISAGTLAISQEANLGAIGGGLTINAGTLEVTTGFSTSRTTTLGSATSTFQIDPSQTYTATGAIGGTGALVKTGSGTMVLAVANTYSGGTTINAGTLSVIANALGSGVLTINAGTLEIATGFSTTRAITLGNAASTFQVDSGQTYTNTTAFGGTGSLTKTGAGTMVLGAAEAYGGSTTVSAGTLQINASERVPNASALTVSGGTFDVQTFTETVAGVTLSSGSIIGSGAGTLIGSSYAVQSGTVSAILGGTGALTKTTSGTVTLSGTNTYSGGTIINAGIAAINSVSSFGAIGGAVTLNAGTVEVTTGFSTTRVFTLGDAASTFQIDPAQTFTDTVAIGGTGALNKTGTGIMVLSGVNTYSGGNVLSAGTLQLSGSGTLGSTSGSLTVNGGTLDLNGTNQSVGVLSGSGGTILNNSTGTATTLTVGTGNGTGSYAGVIADHSAGTGTLALIKNGSGSQTLTGINTYTGATTVNAGSLFVNGSTATGSAVTVNNSGSTLGGGGTINGSINVASSGANLSPGASGIGSTAILHTGAVTLASGSNFNVDINGTTAGSGYDQLGVTGTVSITGSNLVITAGSSLSIGQKFFIVLNDGSDLITGTFAQGASITASNNGDVFLINYLDNGDSGIVGNDISLTVTAVPEPSTYIAGIFALAALVYHQRRRLFNRGSSFA